MNASGELIKAVCLIFFQGKHGTGRSREQWVVGEATEGGDRRTLVQVRHVS